VNETHKFITRYLKATHCDLFFADAAIFVEGPAERILLPQFLRKEFPDLRQCYITILEIGGSHAHRLRPLIEHLGLVTLIITDLDAASDDWGATPPRRNQNQITRNATIRTWVPAISSVDDLLDAKEEDKVKQYDQFFSVRVAFQHAVMISMHGAAPDEALPYTFEDALVYDNLNVFGNFVGDGIIKRFNKAIAENATSETLTEKIFDLLKRARKAELALDLLDIQQEPWPVRCPTYIRNGLEWLQSRLQSKPTESACAEQAAVEEPALAAV
jgi:predicted ATP-dependent endonuclease of OLD family